MRCKAALERIRCGTTTGVCLFGGDVAATRCGLEFFGPDQVVFATDTPLGPIAPTIATVKRLGLGPADERKLFCGNAEKLLRPGMFARIKVDVGVRPDSILVPQRAVQQNQSLQTVYAVGAGNKIEARVVKTGERVGDSWLIEQGLRPGDRIVVEGLLTSRPGMVVTPVPYQEKAPAPDTRKGS
jgi:multidrug efflux pump subunit AcrA (membrane-fusion protein)